MIVHKYFRSEHAIDTLQNLRIKVSGFSDFNDPFEMLPSMLGMSKELAEDVLNNDEYLKHLYQYGVTERKINKSYEVFKKEIQDPGSIKLRSEAISMKSGEGLRKRLEYLRGRSSEIALWASFCSALTESRDEVLMWSHYADGHKGIRIAFDTDSKIFGDRLIEVKYQIKRPQLNPADYIEKGRPFLSEFFKNIIDVKSASWSYEKEYRLVVPTRICQKDKDIMFVVIEAKTIVGIDFGLRFPEENISTVKQLVKNSSLNNIFIRKANLDENDFKMNYLEC